MVGTTLGRQNLTEVQTYDDTELPSLQIVTICINIIILGTGVIGNGLVIFVTGYKMKTTVNSIWFLNLAITDFTMTPILVCFLIFQFGKSAVLNIDLRKFVNFILVINMFATAFFLTVISLDRCLCTWVVVWAQNKRTLVKARIICVFVWLLSICCSIPYAIHIYKPESTFLGSLFIYKFTVGFLIPFLIITSSYIAIVVRVRRLPRGNQLRIFRVLILIFAFLICWFPYSFLEYTHPRTNWIFCLVFLNSSLNPIIYVFMCDEYKKKLKRSLLLLLEGAFTEDHLGLH